MDTKTAAEFWNDDSRRLATIVGGIVVGGYALTHPRVIKYGLLLGAGELLRRYLPLPAPIRPLAGVRRRSESVKGHASITIAKDADQVYQFWRDLNHAPKFMSGVKEVRTVSDNVAVWRMRTLHGKTVSWVGERTEDIPGALIAWQIIGSDVMSGSGNVRFEKGQLPGTTEVRVQQEVCLPVSTSNWITRGYMKRRLEESLRRLKQLIETGETARVDGQPAGERSMAGRIAHEYVKPVLIPQ
jgi:uncharacterized membrane protein